MDLVGLLEQIPTLLHMCVGDEIAVLKVLRLVGKRFSKIALKALKTYTLTLTGSSKDTNVSGARLLRHTQLQALNVSLDLSGMYPHSMMNRTET